MKLWLIEKAISLKEDVFTKHFNEKEDVIIFFSYWAHKQFKLKNTVHLFANDFLDAKEIKEIEKAYHQFSSKWKYIGKNDFTLINDISFGFINEPALHEEFHLLILMKFGGIFINILEKFNDIDEVFYDLSNITMKKGCKKNFPLGLHKRDLLDQILGKNDIKKTYIDVNSLNYFATCEEIIFQKPLSRISSKTNKSPRMKRRIIYSKLYGLFNRIIKPKVKPKYYICNYFNVNSLAEKFGPTACISEMGRKNLTSGNTLIDFNESNLKVDKTIQEKISLISNNIDNIKNDFFVFKGLNYYSFFKPALKILTKHHIFDSYKYYLNFLKSLDSKNFKAIIVKDVGTREGRALVAFSRSIKLKSFFVGHGIGCSPHDEKHLTGANPDYAIVPDNKFKFTHPDYSLSSEHIQLGNPSLDHYTPCKRKTIRKIKKVMLQNWQGNSFYSINRFGNEELFNFELVKIIKFLLSKEIDFHFRPRPYYKELYEELFLQNDINPKEVVVSGLEKTYQSVINDFDIVIGNTSTALHESYATGVPYIMLEPLYKSYNFTNICAGENWKDIIRTENAEQTIEILKRNLDDAKEIRNFFKGFYKRTESKYYHSLDGNSSDRIFKFINQKCTF